MAGLIDALKTRLGTFTREERGNVTVEFVLAMPILFWTFMAGYTFFDGYRQSTQNLKAAYTISDLISRELYDINDEYIDSMQKLMTIMTRATSVVDMRISVLRWDEPDEKFYVHWSADRGFGEALTDGAVSGYSDRLPVMPDNEHIILVETRNVFVPLYNVGLDNINLENFVFTRPRFASTVNWDDDGSGV
jgi:Flp pilus assembly protein TadG